MGKKRKRPATTDATSAAEDEDTAGELTGVVHSGELYLRDQAGRVFAAERDESGRRVLMGEWDPTTQSITFAAPSAAAPAPAPAPAPSVPHPVPQPLAFGADEDDHCETAPEAYSDVVPLLTLLAEALGKTPATLRIYDPYYCNGAVARHLAALGFPLVHNVNEDFYSVLADGAVPEHDVLLTNPPYSADHPQRLLAFVASNAKPWLALMPNWVCTRDYYAPTASGGAHRQPFYLVPTKRYHYWTPRGRRADVESGGRKARTHGHTKAALGARTSPFVSFWYVGHVDDAVRRALREREREHAAEPTAPPPRVRLCWKLSKLPSSVLP